MVACLRHQLGRWRTLQLVAVVCMLQSVNLKHFCTYVFANLSGGGGTVIAAICAAIYVGLLTHLRCLHISSCFCRISVQRDCCSVLQSVVCVLVLALLTPLRAACIGPER